MLRLLFSTDKDSQQTNWIIAAIRILAAAGYSALLSWLVICTFLEVVGMSVYILLYRSSLCNKMNDYFHNQPICIYFHAT